MKNKGKTKRLMWMTTAACAMMFLGMGVSSVVGIFESVVAVLPIVICFGNPSRKAASGIWKSSWSSSKSRMPRG